MEDTCTISATTVKEAGWVGIGEVNAILLEKKERNFTDGLPGSLHGELPERNFKAVIGYYQFKENDYID